MTLATTAFFAASKPFEVPPAGKLFNYEPLFKIGPLAVTFPTLLMFGLTLLVFVFFYRAFWNAKLVPQGVQNFGEASVDFVRNQIVGPVLGPEGARWVPFLTIMFFWVFLNNLMEIIPGVQFPVTSRIAYPAMLAILAWLIFNGIGIKQQGFFGYFKGILFPPGVPKYIYVILTPIEFFSTIIMRPLTLALRLFANMVAGHMLLTVLFLATSVFLAGSILGKGLFWVPLGFGAIMTGFELFIAAMQAFIITILTAVYIAGAQEAHH
ncbi:MAG: F0F1 ATP synthase subunit A [Actinomycetota bacterium]